MAREGLTRREFLQAGMAAAIGPLFLGRPGPPRRRRPTTPRLRRRLLGRTGAYVSLLGLGGQILLQTPNVEEQAVQLINEAIDLGINYCDTAHDYYPSEVYYGQVMATRRREVFLATKTASRTYDGAWASLEESLTRLQTDHVDLIQLHHLDGAAELAAVLRPDGALAALTRARDQGMVRFIGVTGHVIDNLISAIEAFDFDTVLTRINPLDPIRGDAIGRLIPLAQSRNMGFIGMKVMDQGGLLGGAHAPSTFLRYTLSHPVSVAIVGCRSLGDLRDNVRTAAAFTPMPAWEQAALEQECCG